MKRAWKYGISYAAETPMNAPLPLCGDFFEALSNAAEYGYDGIEIHTRENVQFNLNRFKKLSVEKNIAIAMIATGRLCTEGKLTLIDNNENVRKQAVDGMIKYIDMAASVNTGVIIGWAKGNVAIGSDRNEYINLLAHQLKILNNYSKKKNVTLNIEVINHYEVNIFTTANEIMEFLEAYDLDNCYVHLDTYHMGIEECDPYEAIKRCGSRLGYVHVADNSRRYPGSGQFDFKKILSTLSDIGYTGYVTVECLPEPDRQTSAIKAIKHLKLCEKQ